MKHHTRKSHSKKQGRRWDQYTESRLMKKYGHTNPLLHEVIDQMDYFSFRQSYTKHYRNKPYRNPYVEAISLAKDSMAPVVNGGMHCLGFCCDGMDLFMQWLARLSLKIF